METEFGWGYDLTAPAPDMGLESFISQDNVTTPSVFTQGPGGAGLAPYFRPVNITVQNGVFHVSIYVCHVYAFEHIRQQLFVWFGERKETDLIELSVSSLITGIPYSCLISLLSSIVNTKAKVHILLDQLVCDGLAYFYLVADKIIKRDGGALFIPSYVENRVEDMSLPTKAVTDFFKWIVEDAKRIKLLTAEEEAQLHSGSYVILDTNRISYPE